MLRRDCGNGAPASQYVLVHAFSTSLIRYVTGVAMLPHGNMRINKRGAMGISSGAMVCEVSILPGWHISSPTRKLQPRSLR